MKPELAGLCDDLKSRSQLQIFMLALVNKSHAHHTPHMGFWNLQSQSIKMLRPRHSAQTLDRH